MAGEVTQSYDIYRILAQNRPSGTGAVAGYTKPTGKLATIYTIVVCNTTGSAITYSLYACTAGTTYDQTTALAYAQPIAANETQIVDLQLTLDTDTGTIGVQTSSANAINFTIIGKVKEYR